MRGFGRSKCLSAIRLAVVCGMVEGAVMCGVVELELGYWSRACGVKGELSEASLLETSAKPLPTAEGGAVLTVVGKECNIVQGRRKGRERSPRWEGGESWVRGGGHVSEIVLHGICE